MSSANVGVKTEAAGGLAEGKEEEQPVSRPEVRREDEKHDGPKENEKIAAQENGDAKTEIEGGKVAEVLAAKPLSPLENARLPAREDSDSGDVPDERDDSAGEIMVSSPAVAAIPAVSVAPVVQPPPPVKEAPKATEEPVKSAAAIVAVPVAIVAQEEEKREEVHIEEAEPEIEAREKVVGASAPIYKRSKSGDIEKILSDLVSQPKLRPARSVLSLASGHIEVVNSAAAAPKISIVMVHAEEEKKRSPVDGDEVKLEMPPPPPEKEESPEDDESPEDRSPYKQRADTSTGLTAFTSDAANGLSYEKLQFETRRIHPRMLDSGGIQKKSEQE